MSKQFYQNVGSSIILMSLSKYHSQFPLLDYLTVEILPPLNLKQYKLYYCDEKKPVGLVTWAWVSKHVSEQMLTTQKSLSFNEWRCGGHLYINDFICPFGNARKIFCDLRDNEFAHVKEATSLRRFQDRSLRRTNSWKRSVCHRYSSQNGEIQ